MKKVKALPIAILLMMVSVITQAQESKPILFSLKESIAYSLKNNPSSTIYKNEVLIAKEKKTEALAGYLPQVNGTGTFDDNLKRQVSVIPAGAFSKEEIRIQFGNQYNTNLTAQVDQVLFDRSITVAKEANKVNTLIADLKLLQNNENIVYNTITAYYQILTYNEQEKLLVENEKKYDELLRILQLQYEKGVAKKIDYDRMKVSQNNIKSQLSLLKTNRELALNKLKYAMGMELTHNIAINDSLDYSMQVSMPVGNQLDTKNLLDFKIQSNNIALQQLDVERRKFAFYPTLAGYARYGAQTFGNEFGKSFGNWFDYSSIGLKLNIPIFDGNRKKSQLSQSKLTLLNAQENLKLSERNYELQYQNANTALFRSFTSMNDNKQNLDLAADILKNTSLQYQKGTASLTDFLNSDYSYKEAQSNYISSLLNFLTARVDLEKSQGNLSTYVNQLK
ncbi:TolC family protein [Emticicia sp. BO119]|uniref:TolC family protein n=1 Tax=Emticicia sp. BO119 TaxID=2757768 RepID=UPI0015F0526D|nr:TolC family protein [Emticicia sp. BO119]MBA4850007.1 TolC family protein [Emticicia sp. BO119]